MDRKGYFELADGGTLFLDEIGDMPVTLQAKLLRVLEDGRVTPLGSSREQQVDVRVVAATNADLQSQIASGAFRQDLYFRLAQFTVEVAAAPRRGGRTSRCWPPISCGCSPPRWAIAAPPIDPEALQALAAHDFPGNVRELKNVIERGLIESGGGDVRREHLHLDPSAPPA